MKPSVVNRSALRAYILETVARQRGGFLSRVADKSLDVLESWLRSKVDSEVFRHPTRGRTFRLDLENLNGSPTLSAARWRTFADALLDESAAWDVEGMDASTMRQALASVAARCDALRPKKEKKK